MSIRTAKDSTPESIQRLAETNLEYSERIMQLEHMILGLWEGMKPLFDEIAEIKKSQINQSEKE